KAKIIAIHNPTAEPEKTPPATKKAAKKTK
ncbi:unnamed protein product, partial [marine sediment metagenome]